MLTKCQGYQYKCRVATWSGKVSKSGKTKKDDKIQEKLGEFFQLDLWKPCITDTQVATSSIGAVSSK